MSVLLSWPQPDYVHPESHGQALLVVNLIFITLVTLAVAGRLYARIVIKQWFGADDSMIVLAFVSQPPLDSTMFCRTGTDHS